MTLLGPKALKFLYTCMYIYVQSSFVFLFSLQNINDADYKLIRWFWGKSKFILHQWHGVCKVEILHKDVKLQRVCELKWEQLSYLI